MSASVSGARVHGALSGRLTVAALAALAALAVTLVAGQGRALADGGQSIAAATPVVIGQEMSGDSQNGEGGVTIRRSWWTMNVTAGDQVTITASSPSRSFAQKLWLYRVGATDENRGTLLFAKGRVGRYPRPSAKFIAPATGAMPFAIEGRRSSMGPYYFTVSVTPPAPRVANPRAFIGRNGVVQTRWQMDRDCVSQVGQLWLSGFLVDTFEAGPTYQPEGCVAPLVKPDGTRNLLGADWNAPTGPAMRLFRRLRAARARAKLTLKLETTDAAGQVSTQSWKFVVPIGGRAWTYSS